MFDVEFINHANEVLKEMQTDKFLALAAIGEKAEENAKNQCPVDTGRLRNSISYDIEGDSVYIGTNVEYAPKVEFTDMNHKVGNAHFLKNAATGYSEQYKDIAKKAFS